MQDIDTSMKRRALFDAVGFLLFVSALACTPLLF